MTNSTPNEGVPPADNSGRTGTPYPAGTAGGTTGSTGTADTAKEEAGQVASTAADSGQRVADAAKDQSQRVASEAGDQVRNLVHETRSQILDQAGSQQQRAAGSLRELSDELQSMAGRTEQSGVGAHLVQQASVRVQDIAGWLDSRDPEGLLDDVRNLARRRPGAFLLGAAAAGLAAGRLTRAGVDQARQDSSDSGSAAATARGAVGPTGATTGSPESTATAQGTSPTAPPTAPPTHGTTTGPTSPSDPVYGEPRTPGYGDSQEPPR